MSKQLSDDPEATNIKLFACKRKTKSNELSESDKLTNHLNSSIRKNVEHCFKGHKDLKRLRTHGIQKARFTTKIRYTFENVKRTVQILSELCSLKNAKQKLQEALNSYTRRQQKLSVMSTTNALTVQKNVD